MFKNLLKYLLDLTPYQIINKEYRDKKMAVDPPIIEATKFEQEVCAISAKYSMTPLVRLWSMIQSIKEVRNKSLEGDIVECGVWKGGYLILSQLLIEEYKMDKRVYGYDTFTGMSEPGVTDINSETGTPAQIEWKKNNSNDHNAWCLSSIEEVQKNIEKNVKNHNNIELIQGKVEDTLKEEKKIPKAISILRLDTDWYESTKMELEVLYPRLVKGGILIIDDYGCWEGSKKAVDEYFKGSNVWLHYIDRECRLVIK
jgi:O-methyltransferase